MKNRAEILDEAKKMVCGHREQDYGSPENNFQIIADLWNAYLGYYGDEVVIESNDVAMMMALLKIARIRTGTATEDSFIDLAGYAACGGEITSNKKLLVEKTKETNDEIDTKLNPDDFLRPIGYEAAGVTGIIPDTDPRFCDSTPASFKGDITIANAADPLLHIDDNHFTTIDKHEHCFA